MLRIIFLPLLTVLFCTSYAQQFYSDHGNPIVDPKVPCDCDNWYSKKESVDSAVKLLKTVFYEKDGIRYKRVYYVTIIITTWLDVCTTPATCKGATRKRVTKEERKWYEDTPDCGELAEGQVCCENKPVDKALCCNGKILQPGEVCCKDKKYDWTVHSVEAEVPAAWWQMVKDHSQTVKNILNKIPFGIEIDGPAFSGEYRVRDCCKNDVIEVKDGETKASVGLSIGVTAVDVPCLTPPMTAVIKQDRTILGYTFTLEVKYGLFATVGAKVSGKIGYESNKCTGEECYTASVGLKIPVKLAVKASVKACVTKEKKTPCKGTLTNGLPCLAPTRNLCGYCELHTDQSWWCIPCLNFTPAVASISTSYYGSYGFECNQPAKAKLSVDKVVFNFTIQIWKFSHTITVPITDGMVIYP